MEEIRALLTSEVVTSAVLSVGDPACAFLVAYALTSWGRAKGGIRPPLLNYLLGALGGVVIVIGGEALAISLANRATTPAAADDISFALYLGVSVVWPLAWLLLTLLVWRITRRRPQWAARSVSPAFFISLAVSFGVFVSGYGLGDGLPVELRLPFFAALAEVSLVSLLLGRRGGPQPL